MRVVFFVHTVVRILIEVGNALGINIETIKRIIEKTLNTFHYFCLVNIVCFANYTKQYAIRDFCSLHINVTSDKSDEVIKRNYLHIFMINISCCSNANLIESISLKLNQSLFNAFIVALQGKKFTREICSHSFSQNTKTEQKCK